MSNNKMHIILRHSVILRTREITTTKQLMLHKLPTLRTTNEPL